LPWSIWATMQKFRIWAWDMGRKIAGPLGRGAAGQRRWHCVQQAICIGVMYCSGDAGRSE
jgi:hypothetical protein